MIVYSLVVVPGPCTVQGGVVWWMGQGYTLPGRLHAGGESDLLIICTIIIIPKLWRESRDRGGCVCVCVWCALFCILIYIGLDKLC